MKKERKTDFLIRNNRGAALVSVMIAVAFVTILASSLLYITYTNYQMKVMNLESKNNFYETNGELTKVTSTFRNTIVKATNPKTEILNFCPNDPLGAKDTTRYSVVDVVKLAYPSATGNANYATITQGSDTFTFTSTNNNFSAINDPLNNTITIYTLRDFQVTQKNASGYENKVKTDIVLKVQEVPTGKDAGGVGEFSMLMDGTLDVNTSNFGCLSLYGNTFVSSYDGSVDTHGTYYVKPGGQTKPAVHLGGESKMNIIGDYMVVFGDLVMDGNSCLYIGNGSLTVYGDIILKEHATLICNGDIFMLDEPLPGRATISDIYVPAGKTKADYVFPSTLTVSRVQWSSFENFCQTIHLTDTDQAQLTDDKIGLINQIADTITNYGGKGDVSIADWDNNWNVNGSSKFNTNFYGISCGVAFNRQTTINGDYKNYLLFNLSPGAEIRESNVNTTIISKNPLKVDQFHDIMLTKIGSETFNYLTVDSDDTANPYYNPSIHKFSFQISNGANGTISAGDFFKDDCNTTVNNMLKSSTGGAGGTPMFYSSLQFTEFDKDWN